MSLFHFINEHSYLLGGAAILLILAIVLFARQVDRGWLIWIGAAVSLGAVWLATRTGSGVQFDSVAVYEATIASGKPTLVEFYSDY